jgi:hypothetical protein
MRLARTIEYTSQERIPESLRPYERLLPPAPRAPKPPRRRYLKRQGSVPKQSAPEFVSSEGSFVISRSRDKGFIISH